MSNDYKKGFYFSPKDLKAIKDRKKAQKQEIMALFKNGGEIPIPILQLLRQLD